MKDLQFYSDTLGCKNDNQVFEYLISNLKPSNRLWSYFVNWEKVFENTRKIEINLNLFNYLIGKDNFDDEFRRLIREHPQVVEVIPALVVRDGENTKNFKILVDFGNKKLKYDGFDFTKKNIGDDDIEKHLTFVHKTGLKELIQSKKIKNLVDYMIGVEAGLDSNARKNRSGTAMEDIVEPFVDDSCKRIGGRYIKEANARKIKDVFGYEVPVGKSSRRYDFAIDCKGKLILVETNFYGGGGSKIKSTAVEYRGLFDVLEGKYKFIWITDGRGWTKTQMPLRETFDHNDYLFSLSMLEKGILDYLLSC